MDNTNCLVSRMPEFAGADGKLYNAAWGPCAITNGGRTVQIGHIQLTGSQVEKLVFVPTPFLPSFQPRYFGADQRLLRIYDATKA